MAMKNKPEILAPAGSYEALVAAVRSGADAVYLGTSAFNARMKADNFGGEKLKEAVDYCHARGVKVHVTVNTLVFDSELKKAKEIIELIASSGADAVILQDLGLAYLFKECAPDIERHASTQMSVGTLSGVRLLEELGYKRAVLPRELSESEIREIKDGCTAEIEIFVHGALCMCVSGQCYMSSIFGERSGNRGLCAQPCRLPFAVQGGTGNDLSLKDLSLVERMDDIVSAGVDSLKIEGRMKRPEYVSAAVTSIKCSLEGKLQQELTDKLRAVFSRSGFTQGYFESKLGRDMFGIRQKEDVTASTNKVLTDLARAYEKETPLIPVEFYLSVLEGEKVSLSVSAMGKTCFVTDEAIPEKALNKPLTKEGLSERIGKCGGTQFYAEKIEVELDDGLIVPASVINNLRRTALSDLENKFKSVKLANFTDKPIKLTYHEASDSPKFHIRVAKKDQIPDNLENVENLYLPLSIDENSVESLKKSGVNLGIEVPRGIFGNEAKVEAMLIRAKKMGIKIAYCSTLDALAIAKRLGFEVHTGFSMNTANSLSVGVLERLDVKSLTLSPELTLKDLADIGGRVPRGIIAYGRLPLMLTRNCPVRNGKTCQECKMNSYLTDRMGKKFPVVCNMGYSEILNSAPIYMADRMSEIKNMDFVTFYFTKEKKELCEAIIDAYKKGKKLSDASSYTRGLYYRGAQ